MQGFEITRNGKYIVFAGYGECKEWKPKESIAQLNGLENARNGK